MLNTSEADYFALRRLIHIDAYRKGAITELKLDGHTSLTGANGVGKTSLLRLIPLFYGESPNKLVQGGGVSLNKEKVADPARTVGEADLIAGKYLLVQRGKKNYYLVIAE